MVIISSSWVALVGHSKTSTSWIRDPGAIYRLSQPCTVCDVLPQMSAHYRV